MKNLKIVHVLIGLCIVLVGLNLDSLCVRGETPDEEIRNTKKNADKNLFSSVDAIQIYFPVDKIELYQEEQDQYLPKVTPANAIEKIYRWESSNPAIASVEAGTGKVTALSEGETVITATHLNTGLSASYTVAISGGWGSPLKIGTENFYTRKYSNDLSLRYGFGRYGDGGLGGFGNLNIIEKGNVINHLYADGSNNIDMLGAIAPAGTTITSSISKKEQGKIYKRVKTNGTIDYLYREDYTYTETNKFKVSKLMTPTLSGINVKTTVTNLSEATISNMTFWEYQNIANNSTLYAIGDNRGLYAVVNGKRIDYEFYQTNPIEWFATPYSERTFIKNNAEGEEKKNTAKDKPILTGDPTVRWKRMPSQYQERIPIEIFNYSIGHNKTPELLINKTNSTIASPGNYLITGKITEHLGQEEQLYYRVDGGQWILGKTFTINDSERGKPKEFSLEIPFSQLSTEKKVNIEVKSINEGGMESNIGNVVPLTKISFSTEEIELFKNEKDQFLPDIFPEDATDKNFKWTSSNSMVASIDENSGVITALEDGVSEIRATHFSSGMTKSYTLVISGGWQEIINVAEKQSYYTRDYTDQLSLRYGFGRFTGNELGGYANFNIVEDGKIITHLYNDGDSSRVMLGGVALPGTSIFNTPPKKEQKHLYNRKKADGTLEFLYREEYIYSNGEKFRISKLITPIRLGINVKTSVTSLMKQPITNMTFWEYQNIYGNIAVYAIGENKGVYILPNGKKVEYQFRQTYPMEWFAKSYSSSGAIQNNLVGEETKGTLKDTVLSSGDSALQWKRMPGQYEERIPTGIFDYSIQYNKPPELTINKKNVIGRSQPDYRITGKVTEYLSQQIDFYYRISNGEWILSKTIDITKSEQGKPKNFSFEIPFDQIKNQKNPKLEVKAVNREGLESNLDNTIPLQKIKFPVATIDLYQGEQDQYFPEVTPADSADKNFSWESSNPEVASVNEATGEVTALSEGTTDITVFHLNSSLTDTYKIIVDGGWGNPIKIGTENAYTRKYTDQLSLRYGFGRFDDANLGGFANLNIFDNGKVIRHLYSDGDNSRIMLGAKGALGISIDNTSPSKTHGKIYKRKKTDGTIEFLYRETATYAGGDAFKISKLMTTTPIGINVKTSVTNLSNQPVVDMTFWEYQDTMLAGNDTVPIYAIGDNRGVYIESNGYRIDYEFHQSSNLISPVQWYGSALREATIVNNGVGAEASSYNKGDVVRNNVDTAIRWKQMPRTYPVRTVKSVFDMTYSLMKKPVIALEKNTDNTPGKNKDYLLKGTIMEPLTDNLALYYRVDGGDWQAGKKFTFSASEKDKAQAFTQTIPANQIPVGKNCTIEVKVENDAEIKSDSAQINLVIPAYSLPVLNVKGKEKQKQINLKDSILALEGSLITTIESNYTMYIEINGKKQLFYEEKEFKNGTFDWGTFNRKLEGLEAGKSYSASIYIVDGYGKQSNSENITVYVVGELGFNTTPKVIDYGQVKIPLKPTLYGQTVAYDFEIGDYRGENKRFKLMMKLSKDLTDVKTNQVIKNSSLFYKADKLLGPVPLVKNSSVEVIAGDTGPNNQNQVTKIKFDRDTGLLLNVTNGVLLGDYTGEITWTLEDAP